MAAEHPPLRGPGALVALRPLTHAPHTTTPYPLPCHTPHSLPAACSGTLAAFPTINAAPTLYLSVIVPAYNEEKRIPEERGIDDMIAQLTRLEAEDKAASGRCVACAPLQPWGQPRP